MVAAPFINAVHVTGDIISGMSTNGRLSNQLRYSLELDSNLRSLINSPSVPIYISYNPMI